MRTLIDEFCIILNCTPHSLQEKLFHPTSRNLAMKNFQGCLVQTTYKNRLGFTRTFSIDGLSRNGADLIIAYGRLPNYSLSTYHFVHYNIRLHYPNLPCVVEKFADGGEDRYYPLELLQLAEDNKIKHDLVPPTDYLGNLFTKIKMVPKTTKHVESKGEEEDDEEQCGVCEKYQNQWKIPIHDDFETCPVCEKFY